MAWTTKTGDPNIRRNTFPVTVQRAGGAVVTENMIIDQNIKTGNYVIYKRNAIGVELVVIQSNKDPNDGLYKVISGPGAQLSPVGINPKDYEKFIITSLPDISDAQRRNYFQNNGPQTASALGVPGFRNTANPNPPTGTGQTPYLPPPGAPGAGTPAQPELTAERQKETEKIFGEESGREKYDFDVRYPEDLQLNQQDCVKFSILKYDKRGLSLEKNPNRRKLINKTTVGSIILPIPGGISDSNQVDWQKDDLDLATQGIADVVINAVSGGAEAASEAASKNLNTLLDASGKKALESIVAVKTAQSLLGVNVLSRQYGGILNPNSELLFSGPQLRTFSFTFRMYPRSSSEAIIVRKIIRYFKQAMSVQRSSSILILKAPNTFGIEYLTTGGGEHPYLNKFKECALTQCNVNYTPDGSYMTYAGDEPSMTGYELQLQFQELEPIFNDDYDDKDTEIGY